MASGQALGTLRERFGGGLLTVPAIFVVGSLVLSFITVVADELLAGLFPDAILFRGDTESARGILSSIASAAITLTGLVFSITMLVLQLTGSQYSPRSVGALLTDRKSQYTLGVFVGTFTYSLSILRTIEPSADGFDRGISVAVASLLALLTVAFFIMYVNHVAQQIRPSSIIGRVAQSAEAAIDRHLPDDDQSQGPAVLPAALAMVPPRVVPAPKAGVVRGINISGLVQRATDDDLVLRVVPALGDFVAKGAPLIHAWGGDSDDGGYDEDGDGNDDGLARQVIVGQERDLERDPMYGLRQLVDIAERALSPGLNDPTTAVQAMDQIHNLLRQVVCRELPREVHVDDQQRVRVVVEEPDWQDYLDLAVDEIAHYENSLQVHERFGTMLRDLLEVAPAHRTPSIVAKLAKISPRHPR